MQRGIVYFLLFVFVAMGGALWWWPEPEPAVDLRPVADGPGAALPVDPAAPPPADSLPTSSLPADAPRVHVAVVARERFTPPPPVRAEAVALADGRQLPTTLVAGAGAGFDAPASLGGTALAAIELGGRTLLRQVAVAPGEVARAELGAPLVVTGTVRDATTQRPLVGANVWFGELAADGSPQEVRTDEEGLFTAEVLAGAGVPFVVRMPGFAAVWRPIVVAMPMPPCNAVLQPACTLDVQVVGAAVAMQDARVFVLPQAPVATELTAWPFFRQALVDGVPLDERGRASIDELPRTGVLAVVIRHPQADLGAGTVVALKGERVRALVPMQFAPTSWNVRIVDADAQPLGGVAAWSRLPGVSLAPGGSARLLPPHLDAIGTSATRSRADGTCVVAARDGGVLTLRAVGHAGRDVPAADVARGGDLLLPRWVGGEVQFTLAPPAAGVAWAASTDLSGGLQADLAADAPWRVSLPHAGRFEFVLTTRLGDRVVGTRTEPGVVVTGPIELAPPPIVR